MNSSFYRSGLMTGMLLLFISCFTISGQYVSSRDITYDSIPGVNPNLLSLDIHVPENAKGLLPVMIFIHGGSWYTGDKTATERTMMDEVFTENGYIFVSINYRLSPNPPDTSDHNRIMYPIHPQDCASAIKWVHDNIVFYNGDNSRMNLIGHSAGAHMVSILATNNRFLGEKGLDLSDIKCTCSLDGGALDLLLRFSQIDEPFIQTYYNVFGTDTALWLDASPAHNVNPNEEISDFLLVHQDNARRIALNSAFEDSLIHRGVEVNRFNAGPYSHAEIARLIGDPNDSIHLTDTVMHFFKKCLDADKRFLLSSVHNGRAGQATAILDFDNDGLVDIVTANKGQIHYIKNDGMMQFSHLNTEVVSNSNGFGMYDFNEDGLLDFMIAQREQETEGNRDIRINIGNGSFTEIELGNESMGPVRNILLADFDNDGMVDSYHSASAFGTKHEGNQFHKGITGGRFSGDMIDSILDPAIENFWYDLVQHPERGEEKWSNLQSKGAVCRDLDGDGMPEIINTAYTDIGFQEDDFAVNWILQQKRGIFIFQNNSVAGNISFSDVSKSALGEEAYGENDTDWNVYVAIPFDYDLDGDFDLFVGGNIVRGLNTKLVGFFENKSTPGQIYFEDRTLEAGFEYYNEFPVSERSNWNFASGTPIDFNNDGWIDLAIVNRKSHFKTTHPYVHLFRNIGNGTFSLIPYGESALGEYSGGRDINCFDLNNDGKLDIVLSDGSVGGYHGTDSTLIYENVSSENNHWIQLEVRYNGKWAFGSTVIAYNPLNGKIAGFNEIRPDFSYRSKTTPVIHFGLNDIPSIDLEIVTLSGHKYLLTNLDADKKHNIDLNDLTPSGNFTSKNAEQEPLLIFPNPARDMIYLKAAVPEKYLRGIDIYDITGRKIISEIGYHPSIDVSHLPDGLYLLNVQLNSGYYGLIFIKQ